MIECKGIRSKFKKITIFLCAIIVALSISQPKATYAESGNDRTDDFQLDSLIVAIDGTTIYNSVNESNTLQTVELANDVRLYVIAGWSQKDYTQNDIKEGDYLLFEVFEMKPENGEDPYFDTPYKMDLIDQNSGLTLGVAELIVEKTEEGTYKFYYKVTFTNNIEGKNNISGSATISLAMRGIKDSVGSKVHFYIEGEEVAEVEVIEPDNSIHYGDLKPSGSVSEKTASYSVIDQKCINWLIKFVEFKNQQFEFYEGDTYRFDDIILEESLDKYLTFLKNNDLSIRISAPVYLKSQTDIFDYTMYSYDIKLSNPIFTKVDETTDITGYSSMEDYVRANPLSYTILNTDDGGEKLILNLGAPGSTGLTFKDIKTTLIDDLENTLAIIEDTMANGVEENGKIKSLDKIGDNYLELTIEKWENLKTACDNTIDYYKYKNIDQDIYNYYIRVTTYVDEEEEGYNLVNKVENSFKMTTGHELTDVEGNAEYNNFWSSTIKVDLVVGDVKIIKTDSLYENIDEINIDENSTFYGTIANVEFEVYNANNELVKFIFQSGKYNYSTSGNLSTVKTDAKGQLILTGLLDGTYTLKEKSNIDGYYINQNQSITFTKDKELVAFKLVENQARGVKLTKIDSNTLEGLAETTFKLYQSDQQEIIGFTKSIINEKVYYVYDKNGSDELITDENGRLEVIQLPAGDYYFVETKAKEGYTLDNQTQFSFTLTEELGTSAIIDLGNIENTKIKEDNIIPNTADSNAIMKYVSMTLLLLLLLISIIKKKIGHRNYINN